MKNLKFSIITPTHNPKNLPYLIELYDSICSQTHNNWEWILYLNNKITVDDLPENIKSDKRVNVHKSDIESINIGAIKRRAFFLGEGDVLVEVDHDDMITPDCLEELNKAYQDESVGFVYSDCAMFHMKDSFIPFDKAYGWTHRKFKWKEKERKYALLAMFNI